MWKVIWDIRKVWLYPRCTNISKIQIWELGRAAPIALQTQSFQSIHAVNYPGIHITSTSNLPSAIHTQLDIPPRRLDASIKAFSGIIFDLVFSLSNNFSPATRPESYSLLVLPEPSSTLPSFLHHIPPINPVPWHGSYKFSVLKFSSTRETCTSGCKSKMLSIFIRTFLIVMRRSSVVV